MNNIFLNNNLSQNINTDNYVTSELQNNFLESTLGKTINSAIDLGLKKVLPDFIENEIIEVKDAFITEGFENGMKTTINNAIEFGKNVIGIFNGNFADIEQAQKAVMSGGIIDGISNLLDFTIEKIGEKNKIPNTVIEFIKDGKDFILDKIEDRIKENFNIQVSSLNNINNYMNSWREYFKNEDLENLNNTYEKIQDELAEVMPLEEIFKSAKEIENLQTLIKNNNGDFSLTNEELELSKVLI